MQYLEQTSDTSLITIQLEQAGLDVNFTAEKRSVKEGQAVQFYDRIGGGFPPYSYEWDFGDGSTSTSKAPTHSYKSVGYYTVMLKVTDDEGNTNTYTREEYIKLVDDYKSIVGGSLSTDVIVGFPTETEENFQMSKNILEYTRFKYAYIFKYSIRPGTYAATFVDDIPQEVKEARHKELLDLQKSISMEMV